MHKKYESARNLPDGWDEKAGKNIYLKRDFLIFLEEKQKTHMDYYAFFDDDKIDSVLVCHKSYFDINMFSPGKKPSFKNVNTVYHPVSISRPSVVTGEKTHAEVERILKKLKGWSAIINLEKTSKFKGFSSGFTCPRCILDIKWKSFEEYLRSLRSGYRRRYNIAFAKSAPLTLETLKDNSAFDEQMYGQYLQVLENSRIRLEKLEPDFFRDNRFKIIVAKLNEKTVGFLQLLENGDELIFEFVGFEHSLNSDLDIYHRFLLEIVRFGIENGFKTIDFGQTADDAKLKMGCKYTFLYTHLRHSNPIINLGIKMLIKKMQYRFDPDPKFNVFKEN